MSNEEKHVIINNLLIEVGDWFVFKFFDIDSEKMLDEKIEVLTKLKEGKVPADIPNYYEILENYPKEDENEKGTWDF